MLRVSTVALLVFLSACGKNTPPPDTSSTTPLSVAATTSQPALPAPSEAAPAPKTPQPWTAKTVPLPVGTGPAFFDYIACDRATDRVFVPNARDVGALDVYDVAAATFTRVGGFKTREQDNKGRKRTLGPSSVTVGDGVVYVGNRATSEVCAVNAKTLRVGACLKLSAAIDGIAYVASAKEVWVTTPQTQSLAVLDASKPASLSSKATIKLPGEPEGFAVDESRGLFYTNLEDKDRSLVIDVKTHAVKSSWNPGCGEEGPRGVALDAARQFLFVACTDHLQVLDAAHAGAALGKLEMGTGVDNIDYLEGQHLLYVAAGQAARLTLARVDDRGQLAVVETAPTADRARNAVTDAKGNAYLIDPKGPELLVFPAHPM
ncbi:MAG TPA: hypothetical protein VNO21_03195 [Polyangiaceae bacterium]|nr:hypothetical protein [Polyangiaceae bacterium]